MKSLKVLCGSGVALALTAMVWVGATERTEAADPIKIGASLSLTGRFSDAAKYVQEGYQLWVDETNKKGGIDGHPVELVVYDDESNPDTGRLLAERLIERDNVLLVLGPFSSAITDAVATVTERAEVPLFAAIASDISLWERRNLNWTFQGYPSSNYDHEGFLKILDGKKGQVKKLAIVYEEVGYSERAKDWAAAKAREMGLTVEAYGYTPGSQDFRSIVERIVAFGPEAVTMGGQYQGSIALTRQMIERGFNPIAYHFNPASDGSTKGALGDNADGIFGYSVWEPTLPAEDSQAFTKLYQGAYGHLPSYHSAVAFSAGQVVEAAIKAKGTDRAGIRDFLATNEVKTIVANYKVNEKGQQEGYRYLEVQWQDGELKIVGGDSPNAVKWPKPEWKK